MGPIETQLEANLAALERQAAVLRARLRFAHDINQARLQPDPRSALEALGLGPRTVDLMESYGIPSEHIRTLGFHLRAVEDKIKEAMHGLRVR